MSLSTRLMSRILELPPAVAHKLECQVDLQVPMPDGVVLLANRIAPKGGEGRPIVLIRSPYTARGRKPDLTSRLIAERGYQVVMQNCRGTFGSGGEFRPLRDERDDGLATLRWLADQPWFGGSVGVVGNSYHALAQVPGGAGPPPPRWRHRLMRRRGSGGGCAPSPRRPPCTRCACRTSGSSRA